MEERGQVCATFPPFYALTALLTDGIDGLQLSCLVQPQDGCLRDYALSDWDLYTLASADIIIAGGRGLESFESTLQSLGAAGPVAVSYTHLNHRPMPAAACAAGVFRCSISAVPAPKMCIRDR